MEVVQRVNYGSVKLAGKYNPPSFENTRIPVFGYLIKTKAATILVDTGVGSDHPYITKVFEPELVEIEQALARCETTIGEVDCVVNSHLHFDHCGNNRRFRGITHYAQSAEIEAAVSDNYTIKEWISDLDVVAVTGDLEIADGVTLLETPGHTPGHQSILVEVANSKLLVAAQAAFTFTEFVSGGDPEIQAHEGYEDEYRASLRRLTAIDADRIFLSHDVREFA